MTILITIEIVTISIAIIFVRLTKGHPYKENTVDPVYSERVGAVKSVHYNRVFTINVFNFIIN
jgi:hypothetical protein